MSTSIAVVIPCFNDGHLLAATLRSVQEQTRPADEIVIVDDGSSDPGTTSFLRGLPSPLRVVRQSNQGLGSARNSGIRATTCDLVAILDSDDLLRPTALERLENALESTPDAAFAFCQVDNFGAQRYIDRVPRFNGYLQLEENRLSAFALIHRWVFSKLDLRYPALRAFEDWSFWLSCIERGLSGVVVDEPLFRYRRKKSGMLSRAEHARRDLRRELQERHAALYSKESRRSLKAKFAPGLQILRRGVEPLELTAALERQTFRDFVVWGDPPYAAREILELARGKFLLEIGPRQLKLLERALPSCIEQAIDTAQDLDEAAALVLAGDEATLAHAAVRERLLPCPPGRDTSGDLVLLRLHALDATAADLSLEAGADELVRLGLERNAVLSGLDLFRLSRAPPVQFGPPSPGRRNSATRAPAWKVLRRALVGAVGEARTRRLLHPLKLVFHWIGRRLGLKRSVPILPDSLREERRSLDLIRASTDAASAPYAPCRSNRVLLVARLDSHEIAAAASGLASTILASGREVVVAIDSRAATRAWQLPPAVLDVVRLRPIPADMETDDELLALLERTAAGALVAVGSSRALRASRAAKRRVPAVGTIAWISEPGSLEELAPEHASGLDRIIAGSDAIARSWLRRGVDPRKVRVAHNAPDPSIVCPERVEAGWLFGRIRVDRRATLVGVLCTPGIAFRSYAYLLKTFARLRTLCTPRSRPLHLVLLGDELHVNDLTQVADRNGIADVLHRLDGDYRLESALRDLTLLLHGAPTGHLPRVVLEAMAMQVPIVSTSDALPDGFFGNGAAVVVPRARSEAEQIEAHALATLELLENEPARTALAGRARALAAGRFPCDLTRLTWLAALDELDAAPAALPPPAVSG